MYKYIHACIYVIYKYIHTYTHYKCVCVYFIYIKRKKYIKILEKCREGVVRVLTLRAVKNSCITFDSPKIYY